MGEPDRQDYPIRRVLVNHDRTTMVEWYESANGEILSPSIATRPTSVHLWGPPETLKET